MSTLEVSADGGVRVVRMNRPEQRNAVSLELHTQLTEVWGTLAVDPEVRAVLLCGAGGAFSAGGDVDWLYQVATDQRERDRSLTEAKRLVGEMLRFPQPIVAAVNGPAVGLGSSLASLCDLVVMGGSAFFADPHVALGVVAGDGAVAQRLAQQPVAALRATKRALNMQLERASIGVMDYACAAEAQTFTLPEFQQKLDGAKTFITSGQNSDLVIVVTRPRPGLSRPPHLTSFAEFAPIVVDSLSEQP